MMMTVNQFINMSTEPRTMNIEIYDTIKDETLFAGIASDIPTKYRGLGIDSFYICIDTTLVLNV